MSDKTTKAPRRRPNAGAQMFARYDVERKQERISEGGFRESPSGETARGDRDCLDGYKGCAVGPLIVPKFEEGEFVA